MLIILVSRQQKVDLVFYYFLSHFYFPFDLFFIFSIFRTLGLGLEVINNISHIDGMVTTLITGLERKS